MRAEISRLVIQLMEAWNSHDAEQVAPFYASGYRGIDIAYAEPQVGPQGIRQMLDRYVAAFPDIRFTADLVLVDGNQVALAWTARGTHLGSILRIPATGRAIRVRGVSLLTVDGNQITRGVYIWDLAGLLRSIGLLPEL